MDSTKPYILRALYEWCLDNEQTPHIVVWVNEHTRVPMQFVRDNEIVLNIGMTASDRLTIDNDWVNFSARFGGVAHEIWIPVGHITSFFARESGEGMSFELEPWTQEEGDTKLDERVEKPAKEVPKPDGDPDKPKKVLKFVK